MKLLKPGVPLLGALTLLACHTGTVEPIVIDLTAPTATPAAETPTSPPAATPTPAPRAKAAPPPTAAPPAPTAPRGAAVPAPPPSPESVARERIDAYNNRNLEALVSLYSPDVRVFEPPDQAQQTGIEEIRQAYARRFASPEWSRIEASGRMIQGNFVVERESESGPGGRSTSAIVVSEIREGKIARVWVLH